MAYSKCCREKLIQYRINGQSKPFVDKNLQLQIPGCDTSNPMNDSSFSPIYSHYAGSCPFISYLPSQINEAELYQAMAEAEKSYEAWKNMKQRLTAISHL